MSRVDQSTLKNKLLRLARPEDFEALQSHLEAVEAPRHKSFIRPLQPIEHVYFPEAGICSVVATAGKKQVEVGIVGNEGMIGTTAAVGINRSPHDHFSQVAGHGHVAPFGRVSSLLLDRPHFYNLVIRFVYSFSTQISSTAVANGAFYAEARLARWLLMCQDRVGDTMTLTHEFLSIMVAIRRPSITINLRALQEIGAISTRRGQITVRSRDKLKKIAGKSYGMAEAEYERFFESL